MKVVKDSIYDDIKHRVINFNLVLTNHADCIEAVLEAVYAMAESAAQTIKEFCPPIKGLVSFQSTRLEFRNLFVVVWVRTNNDTLVAIVSSITNSLLFDSFQLFL